MDFVESSYRSLHWVLKIGNLEKSLEFFDNILGLRVLRHEEFSSGCEATCNGPYGGAWSKTMVGYGPEDENFVLELTYNYGIDGYDFGNDLLFIAVQEPAALNRARSLGFTVTDTDIVLGPDPYRFKVVPRIAGRAEKFVAVALRVKDLENAKDFYVRVLGLKEFPLLDCFKSDQPSCLLGFSPSQTQLLLVQTDVAVDHRLAGGRIAFACDKVSPVFESVTRSGDIIQVPPLTLSTPNKKDVVVTILQDRDAYEICFVEVEAFLELAHPTYDVVDFLIRRKKGGDGHGLPPPSHIMDNPLISELDLYSSSHPYVVLLFSASWCRKCDKIKQEMKEMEKNKELDDMARFLVVDIDQNPDLADKFNVSAVPEVLVLVSSSLVCLGRQKGEEGLHKLLVETLK